ncbi:MAG: thioredoxin family protein, partial [Planctomycetaceae bacterium]|nr:thioredoxin family protein [Planctomycetaceae bacterium]
AAQELGIEYDLEKVTDIKAIMGYGVMMTPALAIDGKVVATGKVLSVEETKKLLSGNSGEKTGGCSCGGCCG